ncbi:hypothetical protein [Streptomyces sp. NPDC093223]|uniref:hypothetical protein n=1 Tax=Streptomyces sp. NPDC093223 TaxID=3366033 RepID=UPI003803D498
MSPLSHDTKAIVRAVDQLAAQVRRLADRMPEPARITAELTVAGDVGAAPGWIRTGTRDLAIPDPSGWSAADHAGHGSPCERHPDGSCAGLSVLREQLAEAFRQADYDLPIEQRQALADAALAFILPTTRLTAELARGAEADVKRVIALYERWTQAGPPPLGASMARWWDQRLVELREAILPPANAEQQRCGPECSEMHTETGRCEIARNR